MSTEDELFDDAMTASKGDMAEMTRHVNRADELLNEIAALDASRAKMQEELTTLLTKDIPESMSAAGFGDEGFTTKSGRKIKIERSLSATWPKKDDPEKVRQAVDFVVDQEGGSDLLKSEIVITYDKGFRDTAIETFKRIQKELNSARSVEFSESVHAQTLSKFLRELRAKGVDLSVEVNGLKADDLFNVFYINAAKITEPRKKKETTSG